MMRTTAKQAEPGTLVWISIFIFEKQEMLTLTVRSDGSAAQPARCVSGNRKVRCGGEHKRAYDSSLAASHDDAIAVRFDQARLKASAHGARDRPIKYIAQARTSKAWAIWTIQSPIG